MPPEIWWHGTVVFSNLYLGSNIPYYTDQVHTLISLILMVPFDVELDFDLDQSDVQELRLCSEKI